MMRGTASLIYGAHALWRHPFKVAQAWRILYKREPTLLEWLAFFLHDIGYIGKPDMDGPEGKRHPELGARIMGHFFGMKWFYFCIGHSRSYAKLYHIPISPLCAPDKLATALESPRFYLMRTIATGELSEYMKRAASSGFYSGHDPYVWFKRIQTHEFASAEKLLKITP